MERYMTDFNKEHIALAAEIPDENRQKILRGCDKNRLLQFGNDLNAFIDEDIKETVNGRILVKSEHSGCRTTDKADIIRTFNDGLSINIELKFGKIASACGQKHLTHMFGKLQWVITKRRNWCMKVVNGEMTLEEWLIKRDKLFQETIDKWNEQYAGKELTQQQFDYMFNNLIGNTGGKDSKTENLFMYRALSLTKFERVQPYIPHGTYRFLKMEPISEGNKYPKIVITNGEDTFQFILHYKNNYHYDKKNKENKMPACNGFGTHCWEIVKMSSNNNSIVIPELLFETKLKSHLCAGFLN